MSMISIIIPTYNHREALQKCFASIAAQTFKDYEVIVVDDGSIDGTADAIRNFCPPGGGSNFEFIRLEPNRGAPAARNIGLEKATGEYILFCDADVVMHPDMLQKMYNELQAHPEASYAYSSFKFGWKKFTLWPFDGEKLKRMPYVHSTSLIRRAHFPKAGWDESLKRLQDWDLFLTMLREGHTGIWIPDILFTIAVSRVGYSSWLPSFLYNIPWLPSVKKYKAAETIVKKKHRIV